MGNIVKHRKAMAGEYHLSVGDNGKLTSQQLKHAFMCMVGGGSRPIDALMHLVEIHGADKHSLIADIWDISEAECKEAYKRWKEGV